MARNTPRLHLPSETGMRNSERIEMKFGSYGVEVIESDGRHRVSNLYSRSQGAKICRTYARVRFTDAIEPLFAAEHTRVVEGQSIGWVFKSTGWIIAKRHASLGEAALCEADRHILRLMRIELPQTVATHTYVFEIAKAERTFHYAEITELHHPDYLTASELTALYDDEGDSAERAVLAR